MSLLHRHGLKDAAPSSPPSVDAQFPESVGGICSPFVVELPHPAMGIPAVDAKWPHQGLPTPLF